MYALNLILLKEINFPVSLHSNPPRYELYFFKEGSLFFAPIFKNDSIGRNIFTFCESLMLYFNMKIKQSCECLILQ